MTGSRCIVIVSWLYLILSSVIQASDAAIFDFSPSGPLQKQAFSLFSRPLLNRSEVISLGKIADKELQQKLLESQNQARNLLCQSVDHALEQKRLMQIFRNTFAAQKKQEERQQERLKKSARRGHVDLEHLQAYFELRLNRLRRVEALWQDFFRYHKSPKTCQKAPEPDSSLHLDAPLYLALYHALEKTGPLERINFFSDSESRSRVQP